MAPDWIKTYTGKRIVQVYAKRYGVHKLGAINELRLLGVEITPEYENQIKQSLEFLRLERKQRKENNKLALEIDYDSDSDDTFAYIAGYTSGGCPYGITHEEMAKLDEKEENELQWEILFGEIDLYQNGHGF